MMNSDEGGESRHLFGWVSIILLVSAVLGALWFGMRAARRPHIITLRGGSTVELLGTAMGQETFTTETSWQRSARRYLPAPFQSWIPTPVTGSLGSGSNNLTIWLRILGPGTAAGGTLPWRGYVPEDETGFRYSHGGSFCTFSDSKGQLVCGLNVSAYPRRQREFKLHLLDQGDGVIGTFRVPNRTRGPFPVWKPEPLPQTRTNGPVTLTLLKLEENPQWHFWEPKWRLEASDPAWVKAKARNRDFADSTGNEGQRLSPREAAWKVRALVYRERLADFAPNEQMSLTNLIVPDAGKFQALGGFSECGSVAIRPLVFGGAGTFVISNETRFMLPQVRGGHSTSSGSFGRMEEWGSATPFLVVEALNVQPGDEVEFWVKEDTGAEVKLKSTGYEGMQGGGRRYRPSFTPSDDCKAVTVRIILNRPIPFEFIVSPEEAKEEVRRQN